MSFSWVSASSILLIVAFILVAWSVRSIDRRRRPSVVAQVMATDIMENTEPAFPRDHVLLRQRNDMNSNQSPHVSSGASTETSVVYEEEKRHEGVRVPRPPRSTSHGSATEAVKPRIRTGRTVAAVIGLIALVFGLITGILAPFTAIAWPLPVFLLIVGLGAFGSLRYLALSDRGLMGPGRAISQNASRDLAPSEEDDRSDEWVVEGDYLTTADDPAEGEGLVVKQSQGVYDNESSSAKPQDPVADVGSVETVTYDAPSAGSGMPGAQEVPNVEEPGLDIESLREQARRVAAGKPVAFTPATSQWSPVELPKPTYVDAPAARREAPSPVEVPTEPKSTSSTLAEAAKKGDSVLNLDDVLSRRRA
ncbi:hypothetical protein [Kocuria sp. TGY1127_2]|uniref:hypothetical protein n=1 Tax=Kocuria sp. TGY1127_2 TaxID=2711328 RepID=UPI0015BE52EC|nr:hypothetical protein [Kocuria sp. TGY1127_2]